MPELKTQPTDASVSEFINALTDEQQRLDCWAIVKLMQTAAKAEPRMWGSGIIGFGSRPLQYADGRAIDWMAVGFSPRKKNLSLYVLTGAPDESDMLSKLGPHTCGKSCLMIKRLSDVDLPTLRKLIAATVKRQPG